MNERRAARSEKFRTMQGMAPTRGEAGIPRPLPGVRGSRCLRCSWYTQPNRLGMVMEWGPYCSDCRKQLWCGLRLAANIGSRYYESTYGINLGEYSRMFMEQNGCCAICLDREQVRGDDMKVLYVDHDHATGKVRGLLCHRCNAALGMFADDVTYLKRAMKYLTR